MSRKKPKSGVFGVDGGKAVIEDAVFQNNATVISASGGAEVDVRRSRFRDNGTDIESEGSTVNIENVDFAPSRFRRAVRRAKPQSSARNKGRWGGIPLMPWKKEREDRR